jgi:hypothetical protein
MPDFIWFLMRNALAGFAGAFVFVGGLVALDIAGLGTLALASLETVILTLVVTVMIGLTFGSIQMGCAIMLMRPDHER